MLPKTFPTLFFSSLDLFIGQECSSTCSDRALQVESVGGKLGSFASDRGGDGWVTRCNGLPVTGADDLACW